jgi:HEAT repeat protein
MKAVSLVCCAAALATVAACQSASERRIERAADTAREILAEDGVDSFDRIAAAGVLMSCGSDEANEVIVDALTSGARLAQQAAIGALLNVPGDEAIERIATYADQDEANLNAVLQALRWAPRVDAREFVLRGIRNSADGTRVAAFDAAALSGDPNLLPAIVAALTEAQEEHVRGYGVYAAAALGASEAFPLIEPLLHGTIFEREIAAASLGFVDTEQSQALLQSLTEDPYIGVQIASWASLSNFGDETAADRLFAALTQPNARLASLAAGALRRASPETLQTISVRAGDWSEINVFAAGRVLEAIGWNPEADAQPALERALASDQDELLKLQSLWAVGWRGRSEELALAEANLDDENRAVRVMAAWAVTRNHHGGGPALLRP